MRLFSVYEKVKNGSFKLVDIVKFDSTLTCTNVKYKVWPNYVGKDIWVTYHN